MRMSMRRFTRLISKLTHYLIREGNSLRITVQFAIDPSPEVIVGQPSGKYRAFPEHSRNRRPSVDCGITNIGQQGHGDAESSR